MRLTRFRLFLLFGGSLLLLGPAIGLGQPGGFPGGQPGGPPGGFPGGQPGGSPGGFQGGRQSGRQGGRQGQGGGRQIDPNMIFNMISQGKDYIVVADWLPMAMARDPSAKDKLDAFMQTNGITNGQLTRDQFAQMMQERMAQRQAERAAANPGGSPTPDGPTAATDPGSDDSDAPPPPEKRPVVYRAGNLPKDIPPWFAQLDTDKDGQVGLYEWKAAGRSLSDFQALDLNGDGFITVEEAMRSVKTAQGTAYAVGTPVPVPGASPYPGAGGAPSYAGPSMGSPNGQGNYGQRGNNGGRQRRRGNQNQQGPGG